MNGPTAPQLVQAINRLNLQAEEKFQEGYRALEEAQGNLDLLASMFGMEKVSTGPMEVEK